MAEQKHESKIPSLMEAKVKEIVGTDKNHGWGGDDSTAVLLALMAAEFGKPISEELAFAAKLLVNPSAFRQRLEKKGLLTEQPKGKAKSDLAKKFAF